MNNKDRTFDIENEDSAVNFLEIGQEIRVLYGQELEIGDTEWIPGATVYLRECQRMTTDELSGIGPV